MKKMLAVIALLCLMLNLAGCVTTKTVTTESSSSDFFDGASSSTAVTSSEPVVKEVWHLDYYVDEFDEKTDEWYVTNKEYIVGTFSNSATTDSRLYVQVLVDAENVAFMLYEYGNHVVKNSFSRSENYSITMKTSSGKKYELDGYIASGGDRVIVEDSDESKIVKALKGDGTISFYIYESDRSVSNYLFKVETSNFSKLIK